MNKLKMFAGASIMSAVLMSSVAFAATTTDVNANNTKKDAPSTQVSVKLTKVQKACIATAKTTRVTAMKTANDIYTQAVTDAKKLTDVKAKKVAKATAKKAYKDALAGARTDYYTAKTACMK